MKKLIPCALLAVAASGLLASESLAGCTFGLFYHHCGCCGCGIKVCCRQYNAFSPFCCDCCCPSGGGCGAPPCGPGPGFGGGCGPCADGMCPSGGCGVPFSGGMSCPSGGCADGSCLGSLPAADGVVPGVNTPPASNPVVTPAPLPSSPTSQAVNYRPIQNASYRPVSYPAPRAVSPAPMQPQTMAAPSYWGN